LSITEEQFHQALKEVVEERGADYTYPDWQTHACRYRDERTSEPLCIIGAVLAKIAPEFRPVEGYGASEVLGALSGNTEPWHEAAEAAQAVQDFGARWGDALARYEEVAALEMVTA
jgi:hypothetical protein